MHRLLLVVVLVLLGIVPAPLIVNGQSASKSALVGVLWPVDDHPYLEAFRQGLRDHGYLEGQNIRLVYRYARGRDDDLPRLASELVGLKVDVILTWGTPAAQAAKGATSTIPIVMGSIGDPVAAGIVASLARPGGNITGLTSNAVELEEKRLELVKEVVPKASRVAVLWTPTNPFSTLALKHTQGAADTLHMTVQPVAVRRPDDFREAFAGITKQRPDALMVHGDAFLFTQATRIVDFAARNRLPAVYGWRDFADAGGLIAYAPNYPEMFRRAADFVDKILKGTKPGELAVQQPIIFELVINLKTAKALGLTIPQSLLLRADQVIQ